MIISRNLQRFLRSSTIIRPWTLFKYSSLKPPNGPIVNQDPLHNIETKVAEHYKPDPIQITNVLKAMLHNYKQYYVQEQLFIYKNISYLTHSDLIILLAYLGHKYTVMNHQKIFIATAKRIKQIKQIQPKDFRKLCGLLLRLKWEQQSIAKLYNILIPRLKEMQTQDLCYLCLYGQHVNRINLKVLDSYIQQLLTRQIKDRKSQFILYQALFSTQAKRNFEQLYNYKQQYRKLDNSIKNSQYEFVYGKWQLIQTLSKAQNKKQQLQHQLSKYEQLSLKQAVILGGIHNQQLLNKVNDVFKMNISVVAPYYFSELLSIIPSPQYFKQYLKESQGQLNDHDTLIILQKANEMGIQKDIIKQEFIKVFGDKTKINNDLFERIQLLGQNIGIHKIQKLEEEQTNKQK